MFMASLNNNWITEKLIDFEYKQYILLAYLSEVEKAFDKTQLYPHFAELIEHYKNAKIIKEQQTAIAESFPKKLLGFNKETLEPEFERLLNDNSLMQEIIQIVEFSLPKFEYYLKEGKKIYDFIESHTQISPVGLVPLNNDFGYVFLQDGSSNETFVYAYEITLFERADEKYRGVYTNFVSSFAKTLSNSFERIKSQLIQEYRKWPNPATYAIETDLKIPFAETFLPIAKRLLVKTVQPMY
jgi:hypothetical protein